MSVSTFTAIPAGTWKVDPSHSLVEFRVKHMGISTVKGQFNEFEGTLVVGEDGSASASGTVQVASLDTREAQRDEHLRSADFFDAENHPQITFRSTEITPVDDEQFTVTGEITIRGVTKPITLTATAEGMTEDPWGNERIGLSVTGQLNRSDFGMKFNQLLGSGDLVVADKVKIALEIEAIKG